MRGGGGGGGVCGVFFFFKQKTAYEMCGRDWSSDVCSSDLSHNSSIFFGLVYSLRYFSLIFRRILMSI